jgi:hypothetical protein
MTIIELTNKKEKLLEQLAGNADWSSLHAISALSAELEYDPQYEQGENGIEDEGDDRRVSVSIKGFQNKLVNSNRKMTASHLVEGSEQSDAEIYEWAFSKDDWLEGAKLLMETDWLEEIKSKL